MTREEEIRAVAKGRCGTVAGINTFIAGTQWADEHPKCPWISVDERLPEKINKLNKFYSEPVLCRYTRGGKVFYHVAQYDYDFDEWGISNVTHWMPIPELSTTK